jgi:hypothetical protein
MKESPFLSFFDLLIENYGTKVVSIFYYTKKMARKLVNSLFHIAKQVEQPVQPAKSGICFYR